MAAGEVGGIITRNDEQALKDSKSYRVRVRTSSGEYEGVMFSPHPTHRLSEVLARMEGFVNLKDGRDLSTDEKFSFVVISKNHIEIIKVIEEK